MDYKYETDKFPVLKARFFTEMTEKRQVRLVVIHSMEAPEKGDTAENVARYFQNPKDRKGNWVKASAHLCVDSDSIVQCVFDNNVAYAAPGSNHDGVHIELAGYAKQKRAEWLDAYGLLMLEKGANAAAQYCLKYNIPVKHLSNKELKDGFKGIVGHVQVSDVYKRSNHGDPGKGFPWDFFIERVEFHHAERLKKFQNL